MISNSIVCQFFVPPTYKPMASDSFELNSFFKSLESNYIDKSTHPIDKSLLKNVVPNVGECFFLFDLTKNMIIHNIGMEEMFGYKKENIDLDFLLDIIHPDDSNLVQSIIHNCMTQIVELKIPRFTNVFKITSRYRKSDGDFIHILGENFVFQANHNSMVQSILVRFTDVSFLVDSELMDWWVNTDYLDKADIAASIYGENKNLFTDREREVIILMFSGKKNNGIAKELNISKHTVSTHRKNILSKSDCSGVEELRIFCKKNGVFD